MCVSVHLSGVCLCDHIGIARRWFIYIHGCNGGVWREYGANGRPWTQVALTEQAVRRCVLSAARCFDATRTHLPARAPARSLSLFACHLNANTLVRHTGRESNCWSVCSLPPPKPLTSRIRTPTPSLHTWEITADFSQDSLSSLYQWINGWKGAREEKIIADHHRRRLVKQFSSQFLQLDVALMNNKDLERLRDTAVKN